MKLGIMQPYTFPYIGYFQLINHVDKWVVFDDTQYVSKGWINRNRILHPEAKKEWQYFTVPVKKHRLGSKIKDVEINHELDWRNEFTGKLTTYKKKAPYYAETVEFIGECLEFQCTTLSEWVQFTLNRSCQYLDIPYDPAVFSEMDINTDNINHPGQWALEIADAMQATEYVNPPGGFHIFDETEFNARNISLSFLQANLTPYVQRREGFVPGLSIVDVMMWNSRADIKTMLADFKLASHADLALAVNERENFS